jgi:heme exporter protein A
MAWETDSIFSGKAVTCVRGARLVFRGLDFELKNGDALVLAGPNGSGKSSLLRLMAGLSSPASGRLLWDQEEIAEDLQAHASRSHYVGHATATKPALSASEDLAFWSAFRLSDDQDAQCAALARFGLTARAGFPVRFLSSGQRRRLALARLIAVPAPLWLLDEPTVGLDFEGQYALESVIAEHRAKGGIVVIASHTPIDLGDTAFEKNPGDFSASGYDLDDEFSLGLGT